MNHRVMKIIMAAVAVTVLVLGAALAFAEDAPAAAPKDHAYVGSKACKMCHQSEA